MYKRKAFEILIDRLNEPRKFIQVITGPRQVGKSTVIKQVLAELNKPHQFYSADDIPATQREWISQCWQEARLRMRAQHQAEMVLIIDEIQKLWNWSEVVKKEYDADTFNDINIKVVLLGSSRVMLERGLSESLFGRFEEIRMPHWSYAEMNEAFGTTLEQYIFYGGYPGSATLIRNEQRWKEYISSSIVDATINKDILMDSPISKPALLRQTFELGAAYSSKLLSLTKMIGQLQDAGNTTTLSGYLTLLSQSGLITALQKYSPDIVRRRASVPKFQVFNNALCTRYVDATFRQSLVDHRLWGHIFESAIGTHILNQAFLHHMEVYYWRDVNDEVDFILKNGSRIIAIEVKSNAEKSTKGLAQFKERYQPTEAIVVGESGIKAVDFLNMDLSLL